MLCGVLRKCGRFLGKPEIDAAYCAAAEVVLSTLANRSIHFLRGKVIHGVLVANLRVAERNSDAWYEVLLYVLGNAGIFNETGRGSSMRGTCSAR